MLLLLAGLAVAVVVLVLWYARSRHMQGTLPVNITGRPGADHLSAYATGLNPYGTTAGYTHSPAESPTYIY